MPQSSLSVCPRQQSSEHLATVTHPHQTNWPLYLTGQCSLHLNFLENHLNYTLLPTKACPTLGTLLSHFISASQHCPALPCSLQLSTVSQFWWNFSILRLTIQSLHSDNLYNLVPYRLPVRIFYTNLGWLLRPPSQAFIKSSHSQHLLAIMSIQIHFSKNNI